MQAVKNEKINLKQRNNLQFYLPLNHHTRIAKSHVAKFQRTNNVKIINIATFL